MESITLREVLQRAACRIGCAEDLVGGIWTRLRRG